MCIQVRCRCTQHFSVSNIVLLCRVHPPIHVPSSRLALLWDPFFFLVCSGGIWNVASSSPPRSSRVHCLNLSFISCTSTPKSSLASRYKCPRTNYPCFIYSISSSLFPVWLPHVYTRLKTTPPSVRTVGSTRHRSIGFHSSFLFKSIRDPRSTTRIDIEETIQRGRGETITVGA